MKMAKLTSDGYLLSQNTFEKPGFSGFSENLQENASQFFRIGQIRFKLTKELPTRVYNVYKNEKGNFLRRKNAFWAKNAKKMFLGSSGTH